VKENHVTVKYEFNNKTSRKANVWLSGF